MMFLVGLQVRRKWQPTPVFLPGESHGQRNLWATGHGVAKSRTQLSDFTHTHTHTHTHTPLLQADSLPTEPPGKSINDIIWGLVLNRKINQGRIKNSVHSEMSCLTAPYSLGKRDWGSLPHRLGEAQVLGFFSWPLITGIGIMSFSKKN